MKIITSDDEYSYPLHMQGAASTLSDEGEDEVIKWLHRAVKDVTGVEVKKPEKPRIGFLP